MGNPDQFLMHISERAPVETGHHVCQFRGDGQHRIENLLGVVADLIITDLRRRIAVDERPFRVK